MRNNQLRKFIKYNLTTGLFTNKKTKKILGTPNDDGSLNIWIDGNDYKAHELAWFMVTGVWPKSPIVHRDGVKHNNWIDNLKMQKERKVASNNSTGITGVNWDKRDTRWRSSISLDKKRYNLGSYENFTEAVMVRADAEILLDIHSNSPAQNYVNKMFL